MVRIASSWLAGYGRIPASAPDMAATSFSALISSSRALSQSRRTVRSVTPRTSAISSSE